MLRVLLAQMCFHFAPPGISVISMPCDLSSSRIRSASAKFFGLFSRHSVPGSARSQRDRHCHPRRRWNTHLRQAFQPHCACGSHLPFLHRSRLSTLSKSSRTNSFVASLVLYLSTSYSAVIAKRGIQIIAERGVEFPRSADTAASSISPSPGFSAAIFVSSF